MDDMFKIDPQDAVACYRNYYIHAKKQFAVYTKREYPSWLNIHPDPELLYRWQHRRSKSLKSRPMMTHETSLIKKETDLSEQLMEPIHVRTMRTRQSFLKSEEPMKVEAHARRKTKLSKRSKVQTK